MARWIGASASQRFWQYLVPAARAAIEGGDWDNAMADYQAQAEREKAALAAAVPGSLAARLGERRLESLRREWRSCRDSKARDLATLAEADRRKARRS